ncbi:hypothetical protein CDAR_396351 [Caerostris darwini]|uniref:Uncharacterized protein n=1 Tax=Caerostris darwini TaxID=1538125 RepID=A0AAV4USU7_9ARAC|nr:hypothetical protein CDAR_396351 [Caerostris darwini]
MKDPAGGKGRDLFLSTKKVPSGRAVEGSRVLAGCPPSIYRLRAKDNPIRKRSPLTPTFEITHYRLPMTSSPPPFFSRTFSLLACFYLSEYLLLYYHQFALLGWLFCTIKDRWRA